MKTKKVTEYINESKKPLFTFEILPPLKEHRIDTIYQSVEPLMEYNPSYINMQYNQQKEKFKNILPSYLLAFCFEKSRST